MATLTVSNISPSGTVEASLVAAAGGGDQFTNNGKTFLKVTNGDGTATTVTITAQVSCDQGSIHSIANSVAAGATEIMGPFITSRYSDASGFCQVTYSKVTSLTVGAFALV